MFSWFKNLFKKEVQEPVTELKVSDYPSGKYKIYWEKFVSPVDGGFRAEVKFYPFNGTADYSPEVFLFVEPTLEKLTLTSNAAIKKHMVKFKR